MTVLTRFGRGRPEWSTTKKVRLTPKFTKLSIFSTFFFRPTNKIFDQHFSDSKKFSTNFFFRSTFFFRPTFFFESEKKIDQLFFFGLEIFFDHFFFDQLFFFESEKKSTNFFFFGAQKCSISSPSSLKLSV